MQWSQLQWTYSPETTTCKDETGEPEYFMYVCERYKHHISVNSKIWAYDKIFEKKITHPQNTLSGKSEQKFSYNILHRDCSKP